MLEKIQHTEHQSVLESLLKIQKAKLDLEIKEHKKKYEKFYKKDLPQINIAPKTNLQTSNSFSG